MKKSTSVLFSTLVLMGMFSASASADIKKGQKAYLKQCKKCHGNGTKGAAMKTQEEWEEAFEDDAALFKEWHKGTDGEKYANGKKFGKYAQDLKDFLYEYASDSGNVPSCG
jgi:cytochrome c5